MRGNGDSVPTVTLVDDEPLVLDMLVRAAKAWRYECQSASSAVDALKLLEKRPTPIVVTDLNMPEHDGVWLCRQVHERWPEIAVIVVTGGEDHDAAIQCLNAGAFRYFRKPIKLEEFRHALATTLHTYQLQQEHDRYHHLLQRRVRRQTQQIRKNFLSTIDSLVRTLEARDPYTCGHSLRVRQYSLRLADAIGLDSRQRRMLSLAAKLHDIGKIGIPETVLNKPGLLTEEEIRIVRDHPVIGERILAPVIRNGEILDAIRGHHERLDGLGYPDGLAGSKIPFLARLLTVPDCFDAMTTARAYRGALPIKQTLEILREGAGKQFEPAFVRAFLDVVAPTIATKNGLVCVDEQTSQATFDSPRSRLVRVSYL